MRLLLLALVLVGCGGGSGSSTTSTTLDAKSYHMEQVGRALQNGESAPATDSP